MNQQNRRSMVIPFLDLEQCNAQSLPLLFLLLVCIEKYEVFLLGSKPHALVNHGRWSHAAHHFGEMSCGVAQGPLLMRPSFSASSTAATSGAATAPGDGGRRWS